MKKKIARLAARPEDYRRLGLEKEIAIWEDGHRTNGKFGEYEWWYFDAKLEDGSSLVIIFYTQPVTAGTPGYAPSMSLSFTRDGKHFQDAAAFKKKDCSFARERCCVRMRENYIEGDLNRYTIHYATDKVQADVTLTGSTASWRPDTGHIFFDEKDYFAWLPSVPEGEVEATITMDGKTQTLRGTGYHDHNWGNVGMFWLMHHWYWGRAKVGEYQIISSYITAREKYGYEHFPIFHIAKNGVRLGDDPQYLTYIQSDPEYDPVTKKHYHKTLVYDYNDGQQHYRVTYRAREIIEYFTVADSKTTVQAKASPLLLWVVEKAKLAPSYIRMVGTVTLERLESGVIAETIEAPGLWEQMYFGLDEDV